MLATIYLPNLIQNAEVIRWLHDRGLMIEAVGARALAVERRPFDVPESILPLLPRETWLDDLDDPDHAYITSGHSYEYYYGLAQHYRPARIAEIGVRYGYSLAAMVAGSPAAAVVRGWDCETYVAGSNAKAAEAIRRLKPQVDVSIEHRAEGAKAVLEDEFDLVHIDASHEYLQTFGDIVNAAVVSRLILVDDFLTGRKDGKASGDALACFAFLRQWQRLVRRAYVLPTYRGLWVCELHATIAQWIMATGHDNRDFAFAGGGKLGSA